MKAEIAFRIVYTLPLRLLVLCLCKRDPLGRGWISGCRIRKNCWLLCEPAAGTVLVLALFLVDTGAEFGVSAM